MTVRLKDHKEYLSKRDEDFYRIGLRSALLTELRRLKEELNIKSSSISFQKWIDINLKNKILMDFITVFIEPTEEELK